MTIIEQIKAEIDKLYGEYKDKFHQYGDQYHLGLIDGLDMAEQVLDTIESEKPLGLEEEIERKYANDTTTLRTRSQYAELARYFYDLGCRRTAEKYDEIEYNRQREEEQGSEELGDEISRISERYPEVSFAKLSRIAVHFAKWGAEHLKK